MGGWWAINNRNRWCEMPRGENPNSRKNLELSYNNKGGFDTESARKAQKKSTEAKKRLLNTRRAINETLDEDKLSELINTVYETAINEGNMQAAKMLLDYLDYEAYDSAGTEVNLAYIPQVLPANEPPEVNDNE